jgi:hypothetical protein
MTMCCGLSEEELTPGIALIQQFVPEVQGSYEFLEGSPEEVATQLIAKLRADSTI